MAGPEGKVRVSRIRYNALRGKLLKEHPEIFSEQRHLDEGSLECTYWHYGYLMALGDLLKQQTPYTEMDERFLD